MHGTVRWPKFWSRDWTAKKHHGPVVRWPKIPTDGLDCAKILKNAELTADRPSTSKRPKLTVERASTSKAPELTAEQGSTSKKPELTPELTAQNELTVGGKLRT